ILKFDNPFGFSFTGTISGLVLNDRIDLVHITDVLSANVNGSVLTVTTLHEGTLTYNVSVPSGDGFIISPDNNGGTYLTVAVAYNFVVSSGGTLTLNSADNSNNRVLLTGTGDTLNFINGGSNNNTITVNNTGPGTDTVTFQQGNDTNNVIDLSGSSGGTNVVS